MEKVLKRYSTDKQDAIQQSVTIDRYLRLNNITPVETVEESEHGDKPFMERELGRMIMSSERGTTIIVSEYSRLNRGSMLDNFLMLEVLNRTGVVLYAVREGIRLTGAIDDEFKVFMNAKNSASELINNKARTKEAFVPIKKTIKEKGKYTSKRSGRTIPKLGNLTNLEEAQRLGNIASVEARRNKALKNVKLKQAWMMANMLKESGLRNKEIVKQLNDSGFKTASDNLFSTKNIARFVITYKKIYGDGIQVQAERCPTEA